MTGTGIDLRKDWGIHVNVTNRDLLKTKISEIQSIYFNAFHPHIFARFATLVQTEDSSAFGAFYYRLFPSMK